MSVITALIAGVVGYMVPIKDGEITATDQSIIAQVAEQKAVDQAAEPKL